MIIDADQSYKYSQVSSTVTVYCIYCYTRSTRVFVMIAICPPDLTHHLTLFSNDCGLRSKMGVKRFNFKFFLIYPSF